MGFRGHTVTMPLGIQGFTGSKNPSIMQPGHLPFVEGLDLEAGLIQKEGGAVKLNSSSLGQRIRAGIHYTPTISDNFDVIVLENGQVRRDAGTGTFSTSLKTGLTIQATPVPTFAVAGGETVNAPRKLFLFTSHNQVQVASGVASSMSDIDDPAADWSGAGSFPIFGVQHDGRLWAGGNSSDPHRIYFSKPDDHEAFTGTGSGTLAIFPGEGGRLVGGISFQDLLILFKHPVGIYLVDTRAALSEWRVRRLSGVVGAANHNSIVQIDNDVVYMDPGGNIHLLSATSEFGDVRTSNLSQIHDLGPFMRREVALGSIQTAQGVYYATKRQAWFSVPRAGSVVPDLRIVVDGNALEIGPRFLVSRRDVLSALWLRPDAGGIPRPTAGDDEGFIWLLDRNERSKDDEGYPMRFETADTELGFIDHELSYRKKNGAFLELVTEPQGDWNLLVTVIWDDVVTQQIPFHMGIEGGVALGEFELDGDLLATASTKTQRQRLVGSGRRIRFIFENQGNGQNVVVAGIFFAFTVGDEKTEFV